MSKISKVKEKSSILPKKIAIIGGTGALGSWFANWFVNQRFTVVIWGRNLQKLQKISSDLHIESTNELEKAVKNADYVLVSVPIEITPSLLEQIAPLLKPNSILFDVTSIKNATLKTLTTIANKYPKIRVASIHPMFGPGAVGLKERTIILIDPLIGSSSPAGEGAKSAAAELESLFTRNPHDYPQVVRCDGATHDKTVALTLGLSHATNILFQRILSKSNLKLEDIAKYGGTTFKVQKILSESVIHEDPNIYGHIEMDNSEFWKVLDIFINELQEYAQMIKSRDIQKFEQVFKQLNQYAAKDVDYADAYKKMYRMLQSASEK